MRQRSAKSLFRYHCHLGGLADAAAAIAETSDNCYNGRDFAAPVVYDVLRCLLGLLLCAGAHLAGGPWQKGERQVSPRCLTSSIIWKGGSQQSPPIRGVHYSSRLTRRARLVVTETIYAFFDVPPAYRSSLSGIESRNRVAFSQDTDTFSGRLYIVYAWSRSFIYRKEQGVRTSKEYCADVLPEGTLKPLRHVQKQCVALSHGRRNGYRY